MGRLTKFCPSIFFILFVTGCDRGSEKYPVPKDGEVYEHKVTGDRIMIMAVGNGDYLKNRVEELNQDLKENLFLHYLGGIQTETEYNPDNADDKCVCYYKISGKKIKWHIIMIEEVALNYKFVKDTTGLINLKRFDR